ncbi:nesprin-2-like, partial [Amblyraja radiata]|uniref:nesprin-2-like n=1 Tax=Amblyraja radiata TaxID=386614 RepID=UPI001403C2F9
MRELLLRAALHRWLRYTECVAGQRWSLAGVLQRVGLTAGQSSCSLPHIWKQLHKLQGEARVLRCCSGDYERVLGLGRELEVQADEQTRLVLRGEMSQLQSDWERAGSLLETNVSHITNVQQICSRCCEEAAVLGHKVQELRADVKSVRCGASESGQTQLQVQGAEMLWGDWASRLAALSSQTSLVAACLSPGTAAAFQAQPAHLELQWQQLEEAAPRLGISRGQQQRLLFISRCKRLQEWLTQTEEQISVCTGPTLEETIETLQKACVGELGRRAWRRSSVERLGAALRESEAGPAADIEGKLTLLNNRWRQLGHLAQHRVKRLQETLSSAQSLGREMNCLRSWLAHMESELSKPLVYSICDDQEIERKLAEQQELQREIEQRSAGVASVLRLCDGLLEEGEAEAECDGLQHGSRSLQRRWRNVCSMAVERRMRIEETWRLWQKFLEDYSQFEEWLQGAEEAVTNPLTSHVPYALAREELKKYEALQRGAQESLTQLELINKQYRRLAREHRTDTSSRLRRTLAAANQRWDRLQRRTTAILRRLKHLTGQREEFASGRAAVLVWLTELDLQLTNVEHFSQSHIADKVRQLHVSPTPV